MSGYVMKFLWPDPWIDYSGEDWNFGLVNMGLQRWRYKPPHRDDSPDADDQKLPILPRKRRRTASSKS